MALPAAFCSLFWMDELHLFAGAGGGILGGMLLGHTPVCAVEIEPYCRDILIQRQRDGILPRFPIWDDVRTFDGVPWRGKAQVISGGFPCVDVSPAGKREGIMGERSGLWWEMLRIVREVRPRFVFVENSSGLLDRGLGDVLGSLAESGYDSRWDCIPASAVGANHIRDRVYIVATDRTAEAVDGAGKEWLLPDSEGRGQWTNQDDPNGQAQQDSIADAVRDIGRTWWNESVYSGVDDGVADRMVRRFKAIGNGQVPPVARLAWNILRENDQGHRSCDDKPNPIES